MVCGFMKYLISQRAASLSPSLTLAIDAKAKQMKAEGQDVVGFGAGEPDFDTPQHIKDAAAKALADGFTKYTPSSGIPELRQAIADKFKRENGLAYQPSQVIVSCGGKHSCYNVILATCQEGDEVIIPAPYWLSYPEMVKLAGATPVIVPTTDKTEFKVTPDQLEAAITPRTRLFVLNSPSNPTGSVYTPEEIKALGDVCVERDVLIMSDEIYEHLLYDGAKHRSVASFSSGHYDHTIVVHGFAKAWSMTGWRLGFLAAPEPIAKAIDAIQSHSTSNPTSFAQKGALAALTKLHATTRNFILGSTDIYPLLAAFNSDWNAAVPYSMLIRPGGEVVYEHQGTIDPLEMRRRIIASIPDDNYKGHQAYWQTKMESEAKN